MAIVLTWTRADISKFVNLKKEGYKEVRGRKGAASFEHVRTTNNKRYTITERYSVVPTDNKTIYKNSIDGTEFTVASMARLSSLWWCINTKNESYIEHRDDGPSEIEFDRTGAISNLTWMINNNDITDQVNDWLANKVDLPPFYEWGDNEKVLFKMTFGGVGYKP